MISYRHDARVCFPFLEELCSLAGLSTCSRNAIAVCAEFMSHDHCCHLLQHVDLSGRPEAPTMEEFKHSISRRIPRKLHASMPRTLIAAFAIVVFPTSGSPYSTTTGAPPFSSTSVWKCKFIATAPKVNRADPLLCCAAVSIAPHRLRMPVHERT